MDTWSPLDVTATVFAIGVGLTVVVRQRRRAVGLHVTALALLAIALGYTGALCPDAFSEPARRVVESTGWPGTLRAVDIEIESLRALPEQTFDGLLEQFGWQDDEPEPAPPPDPTPGILERTLVPHLVSLVSLGLRALAVVTGTLSFGIALVWGIASGRSTRLGRLATRVDVLEQALEARSTPLRGVGAGSATLLEPALPGGDGSPT